MITEVHALRSGCDLVVVLNDASVWQICEQVGAERLDIERLCTNLRGSQLGLIAPGTPGARWAGPRDIPFSWKTAS